MRSFIVCAIGLIAASTQADTVDLFIFENATGTDVTNIDINVEIVDAGGGDVQFVFSNDSSIASFISAVYIESTNFSGAFLDAIALGGVSGDVAFSEGVTPPNPAGSIQHYDTPWGGTLFGADRDPGKGNMWGIHPGESLAVDVELDGIGFDDLTGALEVPLFRFAAHIQGVGDDGASIWGTNGPDMAVVPLPPAALAGAGLLGLIGAVRLARRG